MRKYKKPEEFSRDRKIIISERLEYLRDQIRDENISYGEILELQSLSKYIDEGDVELREWAGIPE